MAEILKPDMSVLWAEDGAIIPPGNTKIATGWEAEVPPHQWENYVQNRQDVAIAYILQHGIPGWDATTEYQAGASFVQHDGKLYRALTTNTNASPDVSPTDWVDLGEEASTTTPGVVALATNAETQDGLIDNKAVTPAGLQSKVTSSPTDGTAGRLLKVGDFGLGAASLEFLSNLNTMTTRTGVYVVSDSSTTGTFPPSSPSLAIVQILANQGGNPTASQWIKQVLYELGTDRMWQRYSANNAAWSAWVEGMQILSTAPTVDRGPVYVVGTGLMEWDSSSGAYVAKAGGATGGGADQIFYENDVLIMTDYTIAAGKNAGTFGPIQIADGVTVTVPVGSTWSIV